MSVRGLEAPVVESPESVAEVGHQLLKRIAAGDRHALSQLYEACKLPLFRYLCQLTPDRGLAEEILQDTFVAVWRSAATFENRSSLQTWLFGIARRQAHNSLRRRGLPLAESDELDRVPDSAPDPEAQALAGADRELLVAAIGRLTPVHREILSLVFAQGLSYQECATVLDVPEGTVKSRLSNARRTLRSLLGPRWGGES